MHIIKQPIMIGHKTFVILGIVSIIVFMESCSLFDWLKEDDYYYQIGLQNNTEDTLLVSFYNGGFISVADIEEQMLYPDSIKLLPGSGVMANENAIKTVFSEWDGIDSCWLYKYDNDLENAYLHNFNSLYYPNRNKLANIWDAPFTYMPDSIHHFFNYNSWKSWLEDDFMGIVMFTIEESDFKSD